jgi:transposase
LKNKYQKKSHISEVKFRRVLKCFSVDIPATSAAILVGLKRKTTLRIYSLLRDRIVDLAIQEAQPFVGDIEFDESYFGAKRIRGKRGRGAGGFCSRKPAIFPFKLCQDHLHL